MALTQTQLDEAMKPGRFDTYVASIGDHASSVTESIMPSASASILAKDKAFSSATSPINSLLAGEKIQFGKAYVSKHAQVFSLVVFSDY